MKIHLIGIGGVGMAGLAVLLKARGHEVSGCDLKATPRTKWLEGQGIEIRIGHSPEHLKDMDEVIVTPAVRKDNPERTACEGRMPIRLRGEVLAELASEGDCVAVCGSHGKTTTSTWIAKLLLALGEDVEWCIGGETGIFPVSGVAGRQEGGEGVGKGTVLVVEADESDGTLALYRARTLVVNTCEYDHPDHFKTEADYFACYETAKRNAAEVIESERLDLGLLESGLFEPLKDLPPHNRRNARAAIEVAVRRGHSLESIAAVLPEIVAELPDRRFQVIYPTEVEKNSAPVTVVTDYAHHPTEMRCAVQMARQKCAGKLRVLFQPHRYSRTKALLRDFPAAFEGADEVVLCPTYAAFERPIEGGDVADLYRACRESGVCAGLYLSRSCEEAWEHARNSMREGDWTLLLGAGDIINLVPLARTDLGGAGHGQTRRIWIGAGTNTWRPDLNLNVEYARTTGPADRPGASLGIPWMAGIPGTIGGWVKMNAGAFGHSISEVVESVKVDGAWRTAAECGFAYRHSDIDGEIQDVKWRDDLVRQAKARFAADEFLARRKRFPAGTYGSFFKNPEGDHAGRLLEEAGAKDLRVGGAYVWNEHANVIVRGEGATSSDVLALARLMRNRVWFRFGIALEPEVQGIVL